MSLQIGMLLDNIRDQIPDIIAEFLNLNIEVLNMLALPLKLNKLGLLIK